jgi:hypothetical protein
MQRPMNEEARQLLRRIVESLAWHQLAAINMLGHCLKLVVEIDAKLRVATELDLALRLFREVRDLYAGLGWSDLESAVRERLDRIPYPTSRLEFGVAYYVTGLAEQVAMRAYADSSAREFAAIARSYVEASEARPEPSRFQEFCAEPANRVIAQQHLNRWVEIALTSFGRPGTSGDRRALQLGLRSQGSAALREEFLERLRPFRESCGLGLPELAALGVAPRP